MALQNLEGPLPPGHVRLAGYQSLLAKDNFLALPRKINLQISAIIFILQMQRRIHG